MAWQASHYQAHVDDLAACGDGEAGANDATNGPASARKQDDAGHQQTLGEHLDFQTDDAPGTVAIIISIFTAANALASCDGPDDALSRVSHGCFSAKPAARTVLNLGNLPPKRQGFGAANVSAIRPSA